MYDFSFYHHHELNEKDFSGCCKACHRSVNIIKPHILKFAARIRNYSPAMLAALKPEKLYSLYQILDDLAHLENGSKLAQLILKDPEIARELPTIRSYYTLFFNIHEMNLAEDIIGSHQPWKTLESFPLYPRYHSLIQNQINATRLTRKSRLAFIGCGPVPMSLILLSHLYGLKSVGLDISWQAAGLARRVIGHLGLRHDIEIVCGDETGLKDLKWDMALVAALAEPKEQIFGNLRRILKKQDSKRPVIFRTYTGMRKVLYEPVKKKDIRGFKITRQLAPTGRVNNTTVFAKLIESQNQTA